MAKKKVNLVLSGGSARGLAHIGVLEVLEKHFQVESIIGTSMGAIVGGLYAYGYTPAEILDMTKELKTLKLFSIFKPSFNITGLIDGKGILKFLSNKTKDVTIDKCKIDFAAVAFDLNQTKTVVLKSGSLAKAMRASSSLPLIFEPVVYDKYLLVDGYIEHPLPLKFAKLYHKELKTVAVSVLPPLPIKSEIVEKIIEDSEDFEVPSMLNTFLKSTLYNQASMALEAVLETKPELYISAYADDLSFMDIDEAEEFYEIGKKEAEKAVKVYFEDSDQSAHSNFLKNLNQKYKELRLNLKPHNE